MGVPSEAMNRILYQPVGYNIGRLSRHYEDWNAITTCLGVCRSKILRHLDMGKFAELYSSVTGIEVSSSELKKAGERVCNLFKAINAREGFDRTDDHIPPKWLEPIKSGGREEIFLTDPSTGEPLSVGDIEKLLDDYYEERGWEVETGIPTKDKLTELGLADIVGLGQ